MKKIEFNRAVASDLERDYVAQSINCGQIAGPGPFAGKCEAKLASIMNAKRVLLTSSCTAALELASLLLDLKAGDEVIMPSYTFVSSANAVCLRGARPVFVDIRADTMNIDENLIEASITEKTRAILPIHYAGVGCAMDDIMKIARRHGLDVLEDAAQGFGAAYGGKALGTIGDLGVISFHETKNIVSGEGGAISINSETLIEQAEVLHQKGTNRGQFDRGEVDKYSWIDVGSSFAMSDILAAYLLAQLERSEELAERRAARYRAYRAALQPLADVGFFTLPEIPDDCQSNNHIFYLHLNDRNDRDALIQHLRNHGIQAVFHYIPLHNAPMGMKLGYRDGMLPVTENRSARLLRLPMHDAITEGDIERVSSAIVAYFGIRQ